MDDPGPSPDDLQRAIADLAARLTALEGRSLGEELRALGRRTQAGHPSGNYLNERFRAYEMMALNVTNLGYQLGRQLAGTRIAAPPPAPPSTRLRSKLCVQEDCETDWFSYWCAEARTAAFYHRKIWEVAYICQALHSLGCLAPAAHGVGFGCGEEPFPAIFARHGCSVLATDLAPDAASAQGWAATNQHSTDLAKLRKADICEDPAALDRIALRWVDMNDVPRDLDGQFDFCWSACALEHLGSIRAGFDFIRASLRCLRPGGVAVHTTEYNLSSAAETLDNWPTVLFQRRHIDGFVAELRQDGFLVEEPDYSVGDGILDGFFDIPPWSTEALNLGSPTAHLKLAADGFPATSIGLIIRVPG